MKQNFKSLFAAALLLASATAWAQTEVQSLQWPGAQMTLVEGTTDLYQYTLPYGMSNVLFSDNGNNKTNDLDLYANYTYTVGQGGKKYVVFDNSNVQWNDIKIYYWGNEITSPNWNDRPSMQSVGNNLYYFEWETGAPANVIFTGSDKQTVELNFVNGAVYYAEERNGQYEWIQKTDIVRWYADKAVAATPTNEATTVYFKNTVGYAVPYVYAWGYPTGEKIDIFSNWDNLVQPLDNTQTASKVGAFDYDMNSLWELHGGTGADEASRTYSCGFEINFGCLYDLSAVTVSFEGACPADFTISVADKNGNWSDALVVANGPGMGRRNYGVAFDGNANEVRAIKFESTKAATQWGIKIYDFSVYGGNRQELADTEAPVIEKAEVVGTKFNAVTLALKATDNVSGINFEITHNGVTESTSAASGVEINYTVRNLSPETEYEFTIVAKDAKDNASAPVVVTATTPEGIPAAPVPTQNPDDVKSIYSDVYGNAPGFWTTDWGSQSIFSDIVLNGNHMMCYENFSYWGHLFQQTDVTDMEYLHLDVYPIDRTTIVVVPIWAGTGHEIRFEKTDLVPNQWNAIDIDLSEVFFEACTEHTHAAVHQLKLDRMGDDGGTLFVDNIYFYKSAAVENDEEAPVLVKHEVSKVTDVKATITLNATDNSNGLLTYTLWEGDDTVATKTHRQGEDVEIELTGLTPNTQYAYDITVADASGNTTEKVAISFTTLEEQAELDEGDGEILVHSSVPVNDGRTLRYHYKFEQDGKNVTVTFVCTNPYSSDPTTGIDGVVAPYIFDCRNSEGGTEVKQGPTTFEDLEYGSVLRVKAKFLFAGGDAYTEIYSYTVKAPVTDATAHMHNATFVDGAWTITGRIEGNHADVHHYTINIYHKPAAAPADSRMHAPAEYTAIHSQDINVIDPSVDIDYSIALPTDKVSEGVHNFQLGIASTKTDGTVTSEVLNDRVYTVDSSKADNTQTGVTNVAVDNSETVEFYNLNGVRIDADNLQPGLYIRRAGTKTTKVIIR